MAGAKIYHVDAQGNEVSENDPRVAFVVNDSDPSTKDFLKGLKSGNTLSKSAQSLKGGGVDEAKGSSTELAGEGDNTGDPVPADGQPKTDDAAKADAAKADAKPADAKADAPKPNARRIVER